MTATKQIVVLDIDDVLANFVDPFLEFISERHQFVLKREDIRRSFYEMGISPDWMQEFVDLGNLRRLPVIPDSQECVSKLREYFHLVAMTSREPGPDTTVWMREHFPRIVPIFTREKGGTCRDIGAFGLIEDQPQYAEQFSNSFLIAAPWNEGARCRFRGTWKEITEALLAQEQWRRFQSGA